MHLNAALSCVPEGRTFMLLLFLFSTGNYKHKIVNENATILLHFYGSSTKVERTFFCRMDTILTDLKLENLLMTKNVRLKYASKIFGTAQNLSPLHHH